MTGAFPFFSFRSPPAYASLAGITVATVLVSAAFPGAARAGELVNQRYETRSGEMAIGDSVLDPFAGSRNIAPPPPPGTERVADSVDHESIDPEGAMDDTERETYENYLIQEGLKADPYDHLMEDRWDGSSGPETQGLDDGGYADPAEW